MYDDPENYDSRIGIRFSHTGNTLKNFKFTGLLKTFKLKIY